MYNFSITTKDDLVKKLSKKLVIKLVDTSQISNQDKIQKIINILSLIESECVLTLYCKSNGLKLNIDKFNIPYWFYSVDNKEIEYLEDNKGCEVNLIPNIKYDFILEQFELCEQKSNSYDIECSFKLLVKKPEPFAQSILGNYIINIA